MVNHKGDMPISPTTQDDSTNRSLGPSRQLSTEAAMDDYLDSLGLFRKPVAKDGSCLFRVVAEQVYHTQAKHLDVRKNCVKFMKENVDLFQDFVEGSFDHHIYHLQKPKEWAGQVEISALSFLYKKDFVVYQGVNCSPTEVTNNGFKDKIFMCYSNGNHYDCVYPKSFKENAAMVQALLFEHLYTSVFPEIETREIDLSKDDEDSGFVDGFPDGWTEVKSKGGKFPSKVSDETLVTSTSGKQMFNWEKKRSLDPTLYRNIELEVWEQSRKEQQTNDRAIAVQVQFVVGNYYLASLRKAANLDGLHKVKIEDIIEDQSLYTVTAVDLNQKFGVALEDLQPIVESNEVINYRELSGYYRKSESYDKENDFHPTKRRVKPHRKGNYSEENVYSDEGKPHFTQRGYGKQRDSRSDTSRKGNITGPNSNVSTRKVLANDRQREDEQRARSGNKRGHTTGVLTTVQRGQGDGSGKEEELKQGPKRDNGISSGRGKWQSESKDRREKRAAPEGKSYKRDRWQSDRKTKAGDGTKREDGILQCQVEGNLEIQNDKAVASKDTAVSPLENASTKSESSVEDGDDNIDTLNEKGKPVKVKQNFESPAAFYSRMRKKQTPATMVEVQKTNNQGNMKDSSAAATSGIQQTKQKDCNLDGASTWDSTQYINSPVVVSPLKTQDLTANISEENSAAKQVVLHTTEGFVKNGDRITGGDRIVNNIHFDQRNKKEDILRKSESKPDCSDGPKNDAGGQTVECMDSLIAGDNKYTVEDNDKRTNNDESNIESFKLLECSVNSDSSKEFAVDSEDKIEGKVKDFGTLEGGRQLESPLSFMDTECLENSTEGVELNQKLTTASQYTSTPSIDLSVDRNESCHSEGEHLKDPDSLIQEEFLVENDEKALLIDGSAHFDNNGFNGLNGNITALYEEQPEEKMPSFEFQLNPSSPTLTGKITMPEQKIRILRKDEKLSDVEARSGSHDLRPLENEGRSLTPSPNEESTIDKQSPGIISDGNKEKKTKKVSFADEEVVDYGNLYCDIKRFNAMPMTEMDRIAAQPPLPPMTASSGANGPVHIPISGLQNAFCQGNYLPMFQGTLPIQPMPSVDREALDLPEDRLFLQYFYNLGVKFFCMMQPQVPPTYPVPPPMPSQMVPTPTSIPPFVTSTDGGNIVTESHLNRMAAPFRPQSSLNHRIHHQPHRYNHQPQYHQQMQHKTPPIQYQPPFQTLQGGSPYQQQKFNQDNNQLTNKELPPRFRNRNRTGQQYSNYRGTQEGNQQRQNRRGLNPNDQQGPKNQNNYR